MKQLQQKEFEGVNKPGKFLAWQLKKKREKTIINKIIDNDDIILEYHTTKEHSINTTQNNTF